MKKIATNNIAKTGVSSGPIRKDGKSYRAESQVRKWNKQEGGDIYESVITHKDPSGPNARDNILKYERQRARELKDLEQLTDKTKHQRP